MVSKTIFPNYTISPLFFHPLRQIYGGIGIGIGVVAGLSVVALSNVSGFVSACAPRALPFAYITSLGIRCAHMELTAIVHLDTRLQVHLAIYHRHCGSTSHHHDRRAPTRVSSSPLSTFSVSLLPFYPSQAQLLDLHFHSQISP